MSSTPTEAQAIEATDAPEQRAGRPRDDAREQAILDAALDLVSEVGYDRMSMDAVASRARASKATIYRRWPGKAELVADAVRRCVGPVVPWADQGTLRDDLIDMATKMCEGMSGLEGGLMCGLAVATRADPELARIFEARLHEEKYGPAVAMLERAVSRGELSPDADRAGLLLEVGPGVAFVRLMDGKPLDHTFVLHLVDDILIPLFTGRPAMA
jgi:AcrR family transcriptional regulator